MRLLSSSIRFALVIAISGYLIVVNGCDRSSSSEAVNPKPASAASPATKSAAAPNSPPAAAVAHAAAPIPTPAPPADPSTPPRLTFDSTTHDFGSLSEIEKRSASLHFTNTGGQKLIINAVRASCGCTIPKLAKMEYLPGESGQIDVTFEPAGPGNDPKFIDVVSNSESSPGGLLKLTLRAQVQTFLAIEPRMIETGALAYGKEHHFNVAVSCPPDDSFTIESVKTTNPHVTARVLPPTPGVKSRTIDITVAPNATWGGLFSWLEITARGKPSPQASGAVTHMSRIRIQGQIFGQLRAEPTAFMFGVKPGERFERRVRVSRPSGEPFNLIRATLTASDLPDAKVAVESISPMEYDIIVTATGDKLRPRCEGSIAVVTNVPGEEQLTIPMIGVVRTEPAGVQ